MNCWYAIPSIRPAGGTLPIWRERGYKLAVLRQGDSFGADVEIATDTYLGWARSINVLSARILREDPQAMFVISGGDDYLPDPTHSPQQIGTECIDHFGGTFGVMQCTADRWGDDSTARARWGEDRGAMIDRIAGSPWLGREWCERAYGGRGPMPEEHFHCWADEELCQVAEKLGVYWRRRDLMQYHAHDLRKNGGNITPQERDALPTWAIADKDYREGRALFEERQRLGFPGSNPL